MVLQAFVYEVAACISSLFNPKIASCFVLVCRTGKLIYKVFFVSTLH